MNPLGTFHDAATGETITRELRDDEIVTFDDTEPTSPAPTEPTPEPEEETPTE